tara:strand:- start:414 stop:764 length:351 start_codon:yes stop_codon:yes gene_type:complete
MYRNWLGSIPIIGSAVRSYVPPQKLLDEQTKNLKNAQQTLQDNRTIFDTRVGAVIGQLTGEVAQLTNLIGGTGNQSSYISVVSETLLEPVSEKVTLLIINGVALLIIVFAIIFLGL